MKCHEQDDEKDYVIMTISTVFRSMNGKPKVKSKSFHNQILLANVNFTAWCYIHSAGIAESVFETGRRSLINIYFVLDIKRPTHIERAPSIVGRESDFRSLNVKNTQNQKTRHFL